MAAQSSSQVQIDLGLQDRYALRAIIVIQYPHLE